MALRVLLVTHRIKEYWASAFGAQRITRAVTPQDLWLPSLKRQTRLAQFALVLYVLPFANQFDVIVCVDRHLALAFGMIKQLSGLKTPVVAYQFILPDAADPQRKKFASTWDRVASRGLDKIIVNSSHEVGRYAERLGATDRIAFVPLAVEPEVFDVASRPGPAPTIFSGGMAMRDYPTLFRAVCQLDCSVEVIVFRAEELETDDIPPNVRVRYRLPYRDFLQEMASAQLVVIPLHNTERAAGQGTIIYAQAMRKAVIASDVFGVRDYVAHGMTGWLVPPEDSDKLRQAIQLIIADSNLREHLEAGARAHAIENYSFATYDQRIGQILAEVTS